MEEICYKNGNNLSIDQVIELYKKSTLGERRPIDNYDIIAAMIRNANKF